MYYALINGESILAERMRWVKLQSNGVYVHCPEAEGQGIVLNNEIYHVSGRAEIDKPTVDLIWQDDVTALKEENLFLMLGTAENYETALALQEENSSVMLAVTELYEMMIGG